MDCELTPEWLEFYFSVSSYSTRPNLHVLIYVVESVSIQTRRVTKSSPQNCDTWFLIEILYVELCVLDA